MPASPGPWSRWCLEDSGHGHTIEAVLRLTSRQEPDLHQLGLDDDPGQQEAEGGHEVDEGGGGAAVVPRVADQPRRPEANQR